MENGELKAPKVFSWGGGGLDSFGGGHRAG